MAARGRVAKRGRSSCIAGAAVATAPVEADKKTALSELPLVAAPPPAVSPEVLERALGVLGRLNAAFGRSPCSTGSNNCCTRGGAMRVVSSLHAVSPFSAASVFVDFGCSAGGVCLFVAALFGCRAYGVEVETEPVRLARSQAEREGLSRQCTFLENSFTEDSFRNWLAEIGATHVFAYDKVFSKAHWNHLFGKLLAESSQLLTGISCLQKPGCFLPASFAPLRRAPAAPVLGGGSGYQMVVWQNKIPPTVGGK